MDKPQVKYGGLKKRTNYDTLIDELLAGGPKIKVPDRTATFIRQSPEYQNLLKEDFIELEKDKERLFKEQRKQLLIQEKAGGENSSLKSESVYQSPRESLASQQLKNDLSAVREHQARQSDTGDFIDNEIQQMEVDEENKQQRTQALVSSHLSEVRQEHNYLGGIPNKLQTLADVGTLAGVGATAAGYSLAPGVAAGIAGLNLAATGTKAASSFLSPDPQTQAAASSSSQPPPAQMGASSKSANPPQPRGRSTAGTRADTNEPETAVPKRRGRPPGSKNKPKSK